MWQSGGGVGMNHEAVEVVKPNTLRWFDHLERLGSNGMRRDKGERERSEVCVDEVYGQQYEDTLLPWPLP